MALKKKALKSGGTVTFLISSPFVFKIILSYSDLNKCLKKTSTASTNPSYLGPGGVATTFSNPSWLLVGRGTAKNPENSFVFLQRTLFNRAMEVKFLINTAAKICSGVKSPKQSFPKLVIRESVQDRLVTSSESPTKATKDKSVRSHESFHPKEDKKYSDLRNRLG